MMFKGVTRQVVAEKLDLMYWVRYRILDIKAFINQVLIVISLSFVCEYSVPVKFIIIPIFIYYGIYHGI